MSSRADSASHGGDAGFTLLEVLAVIGILALVTTIFAVDYRRPTASIDVGAAAMRVAGELRAARSIAMRQSRDVEFVFSAEERWYQVEGRARGHFPRGVDVVFVSAQPLVRSAQDARLVFFRDGSSTGGEITLRSEARVHRVRIDWLTGKVTTERPSS